MSDRRRLLGQRGEQLAEGYLVNKGFRIVDRNVRTKRGEMDLIALDGKCLVFIEVRTRSSQSLERQASPLLGRRNRSCVSLPSNTCKKAHSQSRPFVLMSSQFTPVHQHKVKTS